VKSKAGVPEEERIVHRSSCNLGGWSGTEEALAWSLLANCVHVSWLADEFLVRATR
jgi:hypothetical protein